MFDISLAKIFQSINKTEQGVYFLDLRLYLLFFCLLFFGLANGLNNTFSEAINDAANAVYIRSGRTTKANKGLK